MRVQITDRDYEQISAYMDGQLAPNERRKLESRLNAAPELQAALDDMVRTRALLRQAPRRHAPRNFTLTPAMVGDQGPRRKRGFTFNFFPALSFASALATLALVASMVFQGLPGAPNPGATNAQPMMSASGQTTEAAPLPKAGAPVAGAAPAAEPTQPAAEQPGAQRLAAPNDRAPEAAAPNAGQAAPPIIHWAPAYGMGGGPVGMGGGGGGGMDSVGGNLLGPPAANVPPPMGLGGGGMGVGGGPVGNVTLPQESLKSLELQSRTSADSAQPAQANPDIRGAGPILGVPEPGTGGQIIEERSIQGFPGASAPGMAPATSTGSPAESAQPREDHILGVPRLALIQALLAVIAVVTGGAALLLRNKGKA